MNKTLSPASDGWVSFEGSQWSTVPATGARTLGDEGVFRVQVDFVADGSSAPDLRPEFLRSTEPPRTVVAKPIWRQVERWAGGNSPSARPGPGSGTPVE